MSLARSNILTGFVCMSMSCNGMDNESTVLDPSSVLLEMAGGILELAEACRLRSGGGIGGTDSEMAARQGA